MLSVGTNERVGMPRAGDPASASPERPHVALDRSSTRYLDSRSTQDLQRSHLIGQQKKLRADVETMRTDLQALPLRTASRTAQQRLLEAERSLAELDAIYSAQNRNAEVRKPCHLQLPIALAPTQEPPPTAAVNRSLS